MQANINSRLLKNIYFRVDVSIYPNSSSKPTYIKVIRRDTLEHYDSFKNMSKDKDQLIKVAESYLQNLKKPNDWKAPHRYCIAYYARVIEGEDEFSDYVRLKKDNTSQWWRYLKCRLLKETVLIKKVNALSLEERKKLITITDWEICQKSNARIMYGIYGRKYLYERLFNKEYLDDHYKYFLQQLNILSSSLEN